MSAMDPLEDYMNSGEVPEAECVKCRGCDGLFEEFDTYGHQGWRFCPSCFYSLPEVVEAVALIAAADMAAGK